MKKTPTVMVVNVLYMSVHFLCAAVVVAPFSPRFDAGVISPEQSPILSLLPLAPRQAFCLDMGCSEGGGLSGEQG